MRIPENIVAWEKALERQVMSFFTLLGAGEAPECWQQELPETVQDSAHHDEHH